MSEWGKGVIKHQNANQLLSVSGEQKKRGNSRSIRRNVCVTVTARLRDIRRLNESHCCS